MNTKSAAGSQPAAGTTDARISLSTQSTKANMTSQTNTITTGRDSRADFTKISPVANKLAAKLGITIVGCAKSFNAYKDGDIISPDCTPDELLVWLAGYEAGKDDSLIGEQIEQVAPLLAELAKAEMVIQVLMAQASDKKRDAAADTLHAVGFSLVDPMRSKARQAAISAAQTATIAASISGTPS